MRLSTIASIAVIGLSTATIAQVTRAPNGQKIENGNDMAVGVNPIAPNSNDATLPPVDAIDTPDGNAADAAPPPGEPRTASSAPPKG